MLYNAMLLAYLRIKGRAKRSSVLANTTYPAAEFDAWRNLGKLGLNLAHGVHAAHPLQVLLTSLGVQAVCAPICTTRSTAMNWPRSSNCRAFTSHKANAP
jgi:hypothetical protein